ncbi:MULTISPECIES: DUF302 domain-containing protein [unclassified Actinomadura]|uniref:DUF302 domain-containing protein n=1 Tax=unclassified Actinomadura TaxID=2626254 RepID=UPI0011EE2D17|nr:DUF302 domain-containing protein [Actinomadura sp. K4S16]
MGYSISVRLRRPFGETVDQVRRLLTDQGFGVLTEIDVRATLHEKLGESMEAYLILGACNPALAHQALGIDRQIGLLLPCNVVIRVDGDDTVVEALDPQVMVSVSDRPDLGPVADEATRRLASALRRLDS